MEKIKKRYKIVTTPWHTMHFHDLFNALKDHADFYLIHNSSKKWHYITRPLPNNAQYVPYYEKGKYDFAILDLDQQCVNKRMGKSILYQEMKALITDIPVFVINHGTPVYPEFLKIGDDESFEYAEKKCKRDIKEMVGDVPMIVNSYKSATIDEWGWGIPIWHGMNPKDWWDLEKEPRVFTALSPAGCDKYYNREMMNEVSQILRDKFGITLWWARVNAKTEESFDTYREFLGRSLVYLDVSFRTPMNRGRTEAMLSGCCVVQVEGAHDIEKFVVPNKNMVIVPNDPLAIAKKVAKLVTTQQNTAKKIGQAGKKTALEKFNYERYKKDWLSLIKKHIW